MNAEADRVTGDVVVVVEKDEVHDLVVALVRVPRRSGVLTTLLNILAEALE